jgi:adenylyltransferase/sulfurtransferase
MAQGIDSAEFLVNLLGSRYSRQILFEPIGKEGQERLARAKTALIGCGGLGTVLADILVRAGVGLVRIVDRDFVEESNLQRQVLFDCEDVANNLPKAEAARRKLGRINPYSIVEGVVRDVDAASITGVVEDVDVILDGTDNFETRYLINDAAVCLGKPWVYGAVVGSYGMTTTIVPGTTPCLQCLYESSPPPGTTPTCDTAGILSSIVHVIASVQAAEAMKILCGVTEIGGNMFYADVWKGEYRSFSIKQSRNPDCATCGRRQFNHLNAEKGSFATSMCGRNAVQISWKEDHTVDFEQIAAVLRNSGKVTFNRFLLKFSCPEADITLFPDGRAIIEGTAEPERAREIYAKFLT